MVIDSCWILYYWITNWNWYWSYALKDVLLNMSFFDIIQNRKK